MIPASSYIRSFISLVCAALFLSGTAAQAIEVCYPPEIPILPSSDVDIVEYSDLIISDFERYFKEITLYFTCMDRSRQEAFSQYKANSGLYQTFLDRLDEAEKSRTDKKMSEQEERAPSGQ